MKTSIFTPDASYAELWLQLSEQKKFGVTRELVWKDGDDIPADCPLVVVDQAAVDGDFCGKMVRFARQRPCQTVVAAVRKPEIETIVQLMRGGVSYVLDRKSSPLQHTLALELVVSEITPLQETKLEYRAIKSLFDGLTTREVDVLDCVLAGVSNRDAASKLNVSVRTVEARRAKVYKKTESSNVVELVRKIDRLKFLEDIFASRTEPNVTDSAVPLRRPWLAREARRRTQNESADV